MAAIEKGNDKRTMGTISLLINNINPDANELARLIGSMLHNRLTHSLKVKEEVLQMRSTNYNS